MDYNKLSKDKLVAMLRSIEQISSPGMKIGTPELAHEAMKKIVESWNQENFVLVSLNASLKILSASIVYIGSEDKIAEISMSCVLRRALTDSYSATRFIVGHNHPSGTLDPSPEDIAFTKNVLLPGFDAVGLKLLDHIVFTPVGFTPLRERVSEWI